MRKKEVFTGSEIAHVWAYQRENGYTYGRTSRENIFFEGETIYSYGHHFPMARLTGKFDEYGVEYVLVSTDRYSNTTAKHLSDVRDAVRHLNIIYVPTLRSYDAMITNWNYELGQIAEKHAVARKPEKYVLQAQQLYKWVVKYHEVMELEIPQMLVNAYERLKDEESAKAYAEVVRERNKILRERKRAEEQEKIDNFMNFKSSGFSSDYQIVRYNEKTERFETSRGVQIPRALAKVFYELLKNNSVYVGAKLMQYRVDSISGNVIKVGCHTFKIDYLKEYGAKYFG